MTGGIRPYAPCHGRHTRALVLGHTCAIQCNIKWAYVYHGPRGAYMLDSGHIRVTPQCEREWDRSVGEMTVASGESLRKVS